MCEYCKENNEPDDYVFCPKRVGQITGDIINKKLAGVPLTVNQQKLLGAFCNLSDGTFHGVSLQNIPSGGIKDMITNNFKSEV